jgi:mRNA interferase MazF
LKRGTIVTAILSNDYGKPRPALVVQSDLFADHPSITLLPITGDLEQYPQLRIRVEPTPSNGLRKTSDVMVDKIQSLPLKRIGSVIGLMDSRTMNEVVVALALFLEM